MRPRPRRGSRTRERWCSTKVQCDPPETATAEPDELVTPVDEDCSPDDVELDEVELELEVAVVAVSKLGAVPGIV